MKTELICLPCFHRQIERTLGYAGVNGTSGRSIRRELDRIIENASLDQAPARISTIVHRLIRERTGLDPYKQVKDEYNRIALGKLASLRKTAAESLSPRTGRPDALEGGIRAAIAGNVIDFGIYEQFDLDRSVEEAFRLPLSHADYLAFVSTVEKSRNILYLCDNAGEIVFDRVLIETLGKMGKTVTAVVKGTPVINDATMEDAVSAGLAESGARIIDNGNDGIGTLLELCSAKFLDAYRSADMVISKGQANYETLMDERGRPIFFLFKVKCPVVARWLGRGNGDIVLTGQA